MKKRANGATKNTAIKTWGSTSLEISGDDAARLLGAVVEKGFSDTSQGRPLGPPLAPRPTVLPFPVARHRSCGPHWAPNVIDDNDDLDGNLGEEGDSNRMELSASVANPVRRKEKKGLDFSRWKEITKSDDNSVLVMNERGRQSEDGHQIGEQKVNNSSNEIAGLDYLKACKIPKVGHANRRLGKDSVVTEVKKETRRLSVIVDTEEYGSFKHTMDVNDAVPVQIGQRSDDYLSNTEELNVVENAPEWQNVSREETEVKLNLKHMKESYSGSTFASPDMVCGEEVSLDREIDAENCARLAEMSADEIAEEQAEIMARLNPELINSLKKRGQAKVKRKQLFSSAPTGAQSDGMEHMKSVPKLNSESHNTISDVPASKIVAKDTLKDENDKASTNISPVNCGRWDAWSKRVERVRHIRFSLDGNVISSDVNCESDIGQKSFESGYSAENAAERDFLRTEGDPGAVGYTIKEVVALTRSVVPGQRALALQLIAALLNHAISSISQNQVGSASDIADRENCSDWEAIWAFVLGPEPELALSLRMNLDDNHNSVVLACARAIQCALSCDMNESIFKNFEKTRSFIGQVCSAPVFRSKPEVNVGSLHGGFWKYNTKPSNIFPLGEESLGEGGEDERTIQDDVFVAGQDFAAGLVRMGILPKIRYLLETDPSGQLEEYLISILIAIARHSPTCAAAVMGCGRLVQTIASRFASKEQLEINSRKIKSVTLLKVLAQHDKKYCLMFLKNGIFRQVIWQLYRYPFSLDKWIKSGREACKLSSDLLVEQLRFWKVFIRYGLCVSDFSDICPTLYTWLIVPNVDKLADHGVMNEFYAVTGEVYLLLGVLAHTLPNFYSQKHALGQCDTQDDETWSWNAVGPIIDLAIEWIKVRSIGHLLRPSNCQSTDSQDCNLLDSEVNTVLWVISCVLNMLSSVLKALVGGQTSSFSNGSLPFLPEFVPRIGLEFARFGILNLSGVSDAVCNENLCNGSILEYFYLSRFNGREELALSSTCCLQGLVQVAAIVDKIIQLAKLKMHDVTFNSDSFSEEDKILANGILKSFRCEARSVLRSVMKLIKSDCHFLQNIEMFGRGGPAPGVGVGWGASGGGYWSYNTLLAEQDARLLSHFLEIPEMQFAEDVSDAGGGGFGYKMEMLSSALTACLVVGPGLRLIVEKLLKFIFRVPVLKFLEFGIHQFLLNKGYNPFRWNYEVDYQLFANVLTTHFEKRWLSLKKKQKSMADAGHKFTRNGGSLPLETIYEEVDAPTLSGKKPSSLQLEWAYQRLPLPTHWFLSAITAVRFENNIPNPSTCPLEDVTDVPSDFLELAKSGLFFLLGIEAIHNFVSSDFCSPVEFVPVVWRLHALSRVLLSGIGVLADERSRDVYAGLQNLYGEFIDEKYSQKLRGNIPRLLFESEIQENYSTFIERLVEQFAAESYGDILFARQVAVYLHGSVEASTRLATWNALSNGCALDLLPPFDKCLANAEGYLQPIEDDERILGAYVKSWVSGALDKAANRSCMAFVLALHHLSLFIFGNVGDSNLSLRNKLAKLLVRDFSRKQQHEGMLVKLIYCNIPSSEEVEKRLQLLKEICVGCLNAVERLESCIRKELRVA